MSDQAKRSKGPKAQGKKASSNSHPAATAVTSKPAKLNSAALKAAVKRMAAAVPTIHVSFPTPSAVQCPLPFQAMGTAASSTQMAPTAVIHTPNGVLIGALDANPPPPFTWSYTFTNPLPTSVPLALVVHGSTVTGAADENVVPFQAQGTSVVVTGE